MDIWMEWCSLLKLAVVSFELAGILARLIANREMPLHMNSTLGVDNYGLVLSEHTEKA